jgi:hypothetical protein
MNEIILYNINTKKLEKFNNDEKIIIALFSNKYILNPKDKDINKTKTYISKIQDLIPLYNIYHNTLFLVKKEELYHYVFNKHYRIPNKQIYDTIKLNNTKKDKDNIVFLDNYILDVLEQTYLYLLYYYSDKFGKNLTTCPKPSFIPYLLTTNPYYTRSELINLALNQNIIKPSDKYYDLQDLLKLCNIISNNDINSNTLIKHQEYIQKYKYLIKNFTFLSSSKYNKYLRSPTKQDKLLEENINNIKKLIKQAPEFDKDYYIYRFVSDDSFLQNLKVGEIFVDRGFISTTRNPFYDGYNNVFGYVLLKIKIPKKVNGVGICIETYSMFPNEQEIVLAHGSKLKLISKHKDFKYYHTNSVFQDMITKKYEFEWVGTEEIKLNYELYDNTIPTIKWDWNNIDYIDGSSFNERLDNFINKYIRQNKTILEYKNKKYIIGCDYYNSLESYKNFFFIENDNGSYISIQNELGGYDMFFELNNEGSVNFISRYIDNDEDQNMNDELLLELIGIFSILFKINKVYIHPYYKSFKKINNRKDIAGDNIYLCDDIYQYLTRKEKRFKKYINNGIENKFYYFQLDKLKNEKVDSFVSYNDNNDLYYIYKNNTNIKNLLDFYLYLVENNFESIKSMEEQLGRKLFKTNNPFDNRNKYYLYYPQEYLYNNKFITSINKNIFTHDEYTLKFNFGESFEIPIEKKQRQQT